MRFAIHYGRIALGGEQATSGLRQILQFDGRRCSRAPCDHFLLNIRHHSELPVAANLIDPSEMAKSHRFLQKRLIPGKANARASDPPTVHPLQSGERQASRERGSQSTAFSTSMEQLNQQMEPKKQRTPKFHRELTIHVVSCKEYCSQRD